MRILATGLLGVAGLYGQRRFHWQDYCFNHPAAPFCGGNEYAIKPRRGAAVSTNTISPATAQKATPTVVVPGKIDWRFADPAADAVAWFNFAALASSPVARSLVGQIFDGLTEVDEVALSLHDGRAVVMVTGGVTDSTFAAPEPRFKVVPAPGNGMLLGHAEAVDQASRRMTMTGSVADFAQGSGDFWAMASTKLAAPDVKRVLVTASIRERLVADVTVEFNGTPGADSLALWRTRLGGGTVENDTMQAAVSMDADEARQKFGPQLSVGLVEVARFLPERDRKNPSRTRPVIYGLEGGPRVGQEPKR